MPCRAAGSLSRLSRQSLLPASSRFLRVDEEDYERYPTPSPSAGARVPAAPMAVLELFASGRAATEALAASMLVLTLLDFVRLYTPPFY